MSGGTITAPPGTTPLQACLLRLGDLFGYAHERLDHLELDEFLQVAAYRIAREISARIDLDRGQPR